MDHTELRRTGKFLLFSCSAGLIELGSFALLSAALRWPHWAAYLTALVLSFCLRDSACALHLRHPLCTGFSRVSSASSLGCADP